MSLNSSGPLSIGGVTVGQSINLELGRSSNATSGLGDTSLRDMADVSTGPISMSQFYGKSRPMWIATADGFTAAQSIICNSSGEVSVVARTTSFGQGLSEVYVCKFDPSGNIQWQKSLGLSTDDYVFAGALDSFDNLYLPISYKASGYSVGMYAKYNSAGTLSSQVRLSNAVDSTAGTNPEVYATATDSSGNFYVGGHSWFDSLGRFYLAKFNSSGAVVWQKTGTTGTTNHRVQDIFVDSVGNIYITLDQTAARTYSNVLKFDSSGNILWERQLNAAALYTWGGPPSGVVADSSGNAYAIGGLSGSGTMKSFFVKLNNTTSLWNKTFSSITISGRKNIAIDSSNNIYIVGTYSNGITIRKYDSAGNILFQKLLLGPSSMFGRGISVTSNTMYVLGIMGTQLVMAKLKSSGSGNGTYGGFTYSDTSVADETYDIINKTIEPYIMTNSSYVSTTAPLVQGNPSFTFTLT